jgi:hypothetical protein
MNYQEHAAKILGRKVIMNGEENRVTSIYSFRSGSVTIILSNTYQITFPIHVFNHARAVKFKTSGIQFEI